MSADRRGKARWAVPVSETSPDEALFLEETLIVKVYVSNNTNYIKQKLLEMQGKGS